MPIVTIQMIEGRTLDQKRALAKEVTEVISRICEVPLTSVSIRLEDLPKNSFAKAGILVCDTNN